MQDAALTHPNLICQQANALFAMGIAHAIASSCDRKELYQHIRQWAADMSVEPKLLYTIDRAADEPPTDYLHQQGWVLIAFQNALYQLLHAPSLDDGVVDTIMCGGDTDTNAAICGALLGAVYGREAIPAINQHLKRIFADNELERGATIKRYLIVQTEGNRQVRREVEHYNLQAIIAVGFKIENERAVQFRKWANQIVKDYTIQGWTMDVERLKHTAGYSNIEAWKNDKGEIVKYGMAYINHLVFAGDNGRVLGYDNTHNFHHKHYFGEISEVTDFTSYVALVEQFEQEAKEFIQ